MKQKTRRRDMLEKPTIQQNPTAKCSAPIDQGRSNEHALASQVFECVAVPLQNFLGPLCGSWQIDKFLAEFVCSHSLRSFIAVARTLACPMCLCLSPGTFRSPPVFLYRFRGCCGVCRWLFGSRLRRLLRAPTHGTPSREETMQLPCYWS